MAPALACGLNEPLGIVVSGSDIFVANYGSGTISEYTTSGTPVNTLLVTGFTGVSGMAISGSDLFTLSGNAVGEYTTSGGEP